LQEAVNTVEHDAQKAHLEFAIMQIRAFLERPGELQPTAALSPPAGAPIGTNAEDAVCEWR
jgi:hypothetical protein